MKSKVDHFIENPVVPDIRNFLIEIEENSDFEESLKPNVIIVPSRNLLSEDE